MDERFRVEILLREYDTLRAEILQRARTRFELLGFLGVVAGLALQGHDSTVAPFWVVATAIPLAGAVWFWLGRGIQRCARRIAAIEADVNRRVGNGDLLMWETSQGNRRWWVV